MAGQSLFERFELLVATACIASNANAQERGFRQRDIRWLLEFFANWVESSLEDGGIPLKNTQISRYLDGLVDDGYAKKIKRKAHPRYFLTGAGLLELTIRITSKPYHPQKEQFFFVYSFLVNYKSRIKAQLTREGKKIPYAIQLELETLFDPKTLLERQLYYTKRELKKLDKRIADQKGTAELTKKLLAEGMSYQDLAEVVERKFPFSLYTKKPLRQFLTDSTEKQGLWELELGGIRRARLMFTPMREMLALHIEQLEAMKISLEAELSEA